MTDQAGHGEPAISDAALLARFQTSASQPPCSVLTGFAMQALNQQERWVKASFIAKPEFANPMGQVQGGYLTVMLDDVMSVAGLVTSGMTHAMPTLELKAQFLRPVKADGGVITAIGRITKWGRTIAFTAGDLHDANGQLCVTATATAMPAPFKAVKP
jgi:uncharacterized protein (TIGR00369 family)